MRRAESLPYAKRTALLSLVSYVSARPPQAGLSFSVNSFYTRAMKLNDALILLDVTRPELRALLGVTRQYLQPYAANGTDLPTYIESHVSTLLALKDSDPLRWQAIRAGASRA